MPTLAINKKAKHDYTVIETIEAGISLLGYEVKSVRAKRAQLLGSFIHERDGEMYLVNANIPAWQVKNMPDDYDERRSRKLLLNRKEINSIAQKMKGENLTIVPLSLFTKNNRVKVELALVRSKKSHDKREDLKRRDAAREIGRHMKNRG